MVKEKLLRCKEIIKGAAVKSGISEGDVSIVAVTKGVSLPLMCEAVDEGVLDIGENRIQEALPKYVSLNDYSANLDRKINWHMVGHLQSNKVKAAVKMFDLIHSVDSFSLAEEINKASENLGKVQDILMQVNVSGEESKFGFSPEDAEKNVDKIKSLRNISLKGLMTIAPFSDNPQDSRVFFKSLREMRDRLNKARGYDMKILSMGMTDDFEVAVEEGSNMLRLGRALFKEEGL